MYIKLLFWVNIFLCTRNYFVKFWKSTLILSGKSEGQFKVLKITIPTDLIIFVSKKCLKVPLWFKSCEHTITSLRGVQFSNLKDINYRKFVFFPIVMKHKNKWDTTARMPFSLWKVFLIMYRLTILKYTRIPFFRFLWDQSLSG